MRILAMMMMTIAVGLLSPVSARAERLYVAVVSTLTTKGTFEQDVLATTSRGVSREECELRAQAWWAEFGPSIDAIIEQMRAEGKMVGTSVRCVPK